MGVDLNERGSTMSSLRVRRVVASLAAMTLVVGGCANAGPKATGGAALGAAGGGLIAAAAGGGAAGIIGGVLLGGLLGGAVGDALDQRDRQLAAAAAQRSFESNRSGQASTWKNPDTGHSGTITPTSTYQSPSGQYCREYQQTVNVAGKQEKAYGTACRQPDGSWKLTS
jgi:surface antigen